MNKISKIIIIGLLLVQTIIFCHAQKPIKTPKNFCIEEKCTLSEKELFGIPAIINRLKVASKIEINIPKQVTIVAVGDIMMHNTQIRAGWNKEMKKYDFNSVFKDTKEIISNADIAIGNLETTLAGKDKGYTAYPMFNSPEEYANALKNAGFDILTTANNHSLDRKFYGIKKTIEHLEENGLKHTGTFTTKEESEKILIKEINGIRIAFLNYTYGTNGLPIPKDKPFAVNLIDQEKIIKDIQKAKKQDADFVSVSIHWGAEYQRKPNKFQKDLAQIMCKNGADLILGNHPHVLQTTEMKAIKQKDGSIKKCFVAYSMGNFIADQLDRYKTAGVIIKITLEKNSIFNNFKSNSLKPKVLIKKIEYTPTWIDRKNAKGKLNFRILPIQKSISDYKNKLDPDLNKWDYGKLKQALNDTESILNLNHSKIIDLDESKKISN